MGDIARTVELALRHFGQNPGAYYGRADGRSVGVGLVYENVTYPLFNVGTGTFDTVQGLVYVLTHECDIDQSNDRFFNDALLVCPIIPFEVFCRTYETKKSEDALRGLVPDLARNVVYRVQYIPPIPDGIGYGKLQYGGLLYLNQISSTHISCIKEKPASALCALSTYGVYAIDKKLENHLFRPKDETLPMLH